MGFDVFNRQGVKLNETSFGSWYEADRYASWISKTMRDDRRPAYIEYTERGFPGTVRSSNPRWGH